MTWLCLLYCARIVNRNHPKDPAPMSRDLEPKAPLGAFPRVRMRRNRRHDWSRRLIAEHALSPNDFIWPVFVKEGGGREPIVSMPGVDRHGVEALVDAAGEAASLGIPVIAIFPVTPLGRKSPEGEEALNP